MFRKIILKASKVVDLKFVVVIFVILQLLSFYTKGQSVEQNIKGVQIGVFGIWGHSETRIGDNFSFRGEFGLDGELWGSAFQVKNGYAFIPVLALEPRWYYNLVKRSDKKKRIENNTGNFIAIRASYHPDWFVISNYDIMTISDFIVAPTWAIRRSLGKLITYEAGIGIGYRYIFAKKAGFYRNDSEGILNLHLRIGIPF